MKTLSQLKNTLIDINGRLDIVLIEEKMNDLQNIAIESVKSKKTKKLN